MTRRLLIVGVALLAVLAFTGTADAATLGVTAPPAASSPSSCTGELIGQYAADPSTPYFIPAGGGQITQWQTYTAGDVAGSTMTLAVLKANGTGSYIVAALDTETLPNPLPASHIASFTPSSPIPVAAGETLALYSTAADACWFSGGSTPAGDTLFAATASGSLSTGQAVTQNGSSSGAGFTLNVAATLAQDQDASVQTSMFPSATDVSSAAMLTSVVTNGGPLTGPITFFDPVPGGLKIQSATAAMGTCTISGQTVSCTINGLPVGQSATVEVVVTAPTAGSYPNVVSVAVAPGTTDPNSANNAAAASLLVTTLPQQCIVPGLQKVALASARTVLTELDCAVEVKRKHSSIAKGLVIGTGAATGIYPAGQLVTLTVSEGPKKPKKRKRH